MQLYAQRAVVQLVDTAEVLDNACKYMYAATIVASNNNRMFDSMLVYFALIY